MLCPCTYKLRSLLRIHNKSFWKRGFTSESRRKTAGALIIATEILTGKVRDSNTQTLAKVLFNRGVYLNRGTTNEMLYTSVETIHDDENDIIQTVQRFSKTFNYVITSGGIGMSLKRRNSQVQLMMILRMNQ